MIQKSGQNAWNDRIEKINFKMLITSHLKIKILVQSKGIVGHLKRRSRASQRHRRASSRRRQVSTRSSKRTIYAYVFPGGEAGHLKYVETFNCLQLKDFKYKYLNELKRVLNPGARTRLSCGPSEMHGVAFWQGQKIILR